MRIDHRQTRMDTRISGDRRWHCARVQRPCAAWPGRSRIPARGWLAPGTGVEYRHPDQAAACRFRPIERPPALLLRAVEVRAVPPWRLGVDIGWRAAGVAWRARWIGQSAWDDHRILRPGVVRRKRQLPGPLDVALPVAEPIANHELQPGRGQHIDDGRRIELLAGEQLRLTVRGFGSRIAGSGSGYASFRGMFRPKRSPALPITGR
jgi:hypothetical protein